MRRTGSTRKAYNARSREPYRDGSATDARSKPRKLHSRGRAAKHASKSRKIEIDREQMDQHS
jgi:hypothetical protein